MAATETVQIEMPAMGESVTEGTVLDWLKQEGDHVEEGETIVEVSTDKVDAEVPAPTAGVLTKILKGPDEVVKIGEALAEFEPGGGTGGAAERGIGGRRGRRRPRRVLRGRPPGSRPGQRSRRPGR